VAQGEGPEFKPQYCKKKKKKDPEAGNIAQLQPWEGMIDMCKILGSILQQPNNTHTKKIQFVNLLP
jgi:hypothetical protein